MLRVQARATGPWVVDRIASAAAICPAAAAEIAMHSVVAHGDTADRTPAAAAAVVPPAWVAAEASVAVVVAAAVVVVVDGAGKMADFRNKSQEHQDEI